VANVNQRQKNWVVALTLSIFLGFVGADRLYLGRVRTGILKLITLGGLGIWWLIDVILIATDKLKVGRGISMPLERRGWLATRIRGVWLVPMFVASTMAMGAVALAAPIVVVTVYPYYQEYQLKYSEPYQVATEYVSTHAQVIAEIGRVTGFGFWPDGYIMLTGAVDNADLSIDVKGERGSGTLYVQLERRSGEWPIMRASFETSSGQRFNLLMPGDKELQLLVAGTLLEFHRGIQAKDLTLFWASLSESSWKTSITPEELEEAFQTFIDDRTSISAIKDANPVFDEPPVIDEHGYLVLSGHYPRTPTAAQFNLAYVYEHPEWRLTSLGVEGIMKSAVTYQYWFLKSSGAHQVLKDYLSTHEIVIAEIGRVRGFGSPLQRNPSSSGWPDEVDVSITVKGPTDSGTAHAQLAKELGAWRILQAEFETSSGKHFDLLVPGQGPTP